MPALCWLPQGHIGTSIDHLGQTEGRDEGIVKCVERQRGDAYARQMRLG